MARLFALLWCCLWATGAGAQSCLGDDNHHSFSARDITLRAGVPQTLAITAAWALGFEPHDHGWQVRLRDANGLDLSQVTPPQHGPNPRDLFGWHFRNAANTGPNQGDINAPQHNRVFFFAPELSGTGGFKPSGEADLSPEGPSGVGTLLLKDLILSPVAQGTRASLDSARVDLCMRWPKRAFVESELELMARCGLDLGKWTPLTILAPAILSGDFDGDGARDEAVMVHNSRSDQTALAICRAQTWLTMIPQDAPVLPWPLLDQIEAWRVVPRDHGPRGYIDEPPWPVAAGDIIALERIEKSLDLLYWEGSSWQSQRVYGLVTGEPE